jgi:hypothetical protein
LSSSIPQLSKPQPMRKALPWIYLLLAVLGAILPWKANLEFIAESGGQAFDLARFIADASSTAASRSLSADLLVGASAVTLWICVEGPRQKIKGWWLAIPLSFGVAFACAAPFFLFLRERQLQAQESESTS